MRTVGSSGFREALFVKREAQKERFARYASRDTNDVRGAADE